MPPLALPISSLYAALAAILFVYISVQVIRCRVKYKVVLQDGGIDIMARHVRAHANFTESVPLILILMVLMELGNAASPALLHCMGVALIVGRISHFYSLTRHEPKAAEQGKMDLRFRQAGMVLTFTPLMVGALNLLAHALA
jgi:uncharacterized protein